MALDLSPTVLDGARPVLLIHGFGSSAGTDWVATGVVPALQAAGRGAILTSLPGHPGGPAAARGAISLRDVVDGLVAAIDVSGQEQADVVGYSLGARLGWALAATGRVRRLVLGGLAPMEPFGMLDFDALAEVVTGAAAPADPLAGMFAGMMTGPGMDGLSALALVEALGKAPFDPAVDRPTVPALFIGGSEDQMVQGLEGIAAHVEGAAFLSVPGDHQGALASAEFRAAAIDFLI